MTTQANTLSQTGGNPGGSAAMPTPQDVMPRHNNVPSISTPSISSSAMLSELSISYWTGRKQDKKASQAVTVDNHAETGVVNVNKKLLGDCAELAAVHKLTGNIRNVHYAMTMPWSDAGLRIVPTAQYFKYHQTMTDMQMGWERTVDTFLAAYQWEISQAQAKLGDLFNRDEYPTSDQLTPKFGFRLSYIPLPDAGDFRVDIGNEAKVELEEHYRDYYTRQLGNAMNDVWTRLHTALTCMSERLTVGSDGKKPVFRDSLVGNVLDMVELLDVCNVTGDSQMTALKNKLSDVMYGVTAEALREDTHTRTETKRAVDQIIAALPSLDV
jgi:hypothetical protein